MALWRELVELTSCCHQHTACNITYEDTAKTAQLKQTDTNQIFLTKCVFFLINILATVVLLNKVCSRLWCGIIDLLALYFNRIFSCFCSLALWVGEVWPCCLRSLALFLSLSLMKLKRGMRSGLSAVCAAVGVSKSDVFAIPLVSSCLLN